MQFFVTLGKKSLPPAHTTLLDPEVLKSMTMPAFCLLSGRMRFPEAKSRHDSRHACFPIVFLIAYWTTRRNTARWPSSVMTSTK